MSQCPKLIKDEKVQLFLQMEGGKEDKEDDDQDYGVDGELDGVCDLNVPDAPQPFSLVCPGCSFAQVVRKMLHEDRCHLDRFLLPPSFH